MDSYGVTQTRRTLARPIGFVKDFLVRRIKGDWIRLRCPAPARRCPGGGGPPGLPGSSRRRPQDYVRNVERILPANAVVKSSSLQKVIAILDGRIPQNRFSRRSSHVRIQNRPKSWRE